MLEGKTGHYTSTRLTFPERPARRRQTSGTASGLATPSAPHSEEAPAAALTRESHIHRAAQRGLFMLLGAWSPVTKRSWPCLSLVCVCVMLSQSQGPCVAHSNTASAKRVLAFILCQTPGAQKQQTMQTPHQDRPRIPRLLGPALG